MTEKRITFWKIFWPAFTAIIIASIVYALIFFGILGAVFAGLSNEETEENSSKTILHMTLDGEIGENSSSKLNTEDYAELSFNVGKLDINTPKFIVESDATIVAPLIFAWVLGW